MKMKGVIVLGFILLITTGAEVSRAGDNKFSRWSLKGLKGVGVIVGDMEPEVERAGLTQASIQTDVELKLRLAGIPLLSEEVSGYIFTSSSTFFLLPLVTGPSTSMWHFSSVSSWPVTGKFLFPRLHGRCCISAWSARTRSAKLRTTLRTWLTNSLTHTCH